MLELKVGLCEFFHHYVCLELQMLLRFLEIFHRFLLKHE